MPVEVRPDPQAANLLTFSISKSDMGVGGPKQGDSQGRSAVFYSSFKAVVKLNLLFALIAQLTSMHHGDVFI